MPSTSNISMKLESTFSQNKMTSNYFEGTPCRLACDNVEAEVVQLMGSHVRHSLDRDPISSARFLYCSESAESTPAHHSEVRQQLIRYSDYNDYLSLLKLLLVAFGELLSVSVLAVI